MTEHAACCGCCLSQQFLEHGVFMQQVQFIQNPALTPDEQSLLFQLGEAYNKFVLLPNRSAADTDEFVDAIHRCQQLIALRVARRVDPHVWRQPDVLSTP